MKLILSMALIVSCIFSASLASATTLWLAEIGVTNSTNVNIYAASIGNVETQAGDYNLRIKLTSSAPGTVVIGHCVEPVYSSATDQLYELLPIAPDSGYAAAAWVLSQGYTGPKAAAAQVAVWELTWDYQFGRSYDLSSGEFRYNSGLSATQLADVNTIYHAALAALPTFNPASYVIANNPVGSVGWVQYQNYVILDPAPVPPTVLLLGSGLLALGLLRRKWKMNK